MNRQPLCTQRSISYPRSNNTNTEISRLLCAAVVSASFRALLLTDPAQAVSLGYGGESFHLSVEEMHAIEGIRADSLADFASQLMQPPVPAHLPMIVNADRR